ncbi:MAG TPA: GNAT family N-acetyltransferase, partial [Chthonomonadales bacterium]|nr:GNAT family N-acetyltransferase [Chthonomonadales bacterium]
ARRTQLGCMDICHRAETMPVRDIEMCRRTVYQVRPLQEPGWIELVDRHPRSSAFHSTAWLEALHRTYGFEPLAYTTSPPGVPLDNGLVFCPVTSWITGRRIVSLPFSDHCEPLVDSPASEQALVSALQRDLHQENLRYAEIRAAGPLAAPNSPYLSTREFCFHQLDLRPDLNSLFDNFHKSSTQRKILRAEREGLICETGRSPALFHAFWDLLLLTRRRHGVPPQPKSWFCNLIGCFGEALQIRVAFKEKRPVASILTLRHKDTLMYKYGCSDTRYNNLGGTGLLFWSAIQDAKREGLSTFDLGRSDWDNAGLITFKDRWGSTRSNLTYSRLSISPSPDGSEYGATPWAGRIAKRLFPYFPGRVLRMAGSVLYKHLA